LLPERIEYQRDHLSLPIEEVIADRDYGSGPTYAQLREQKIRHYIPLHNPNSGRGKLTPSAFKYDRRKDRYRCPQGHYLYSEADILAVREDRSRLGEALPSNRWSLPQLSDKEQLFARLPKIPRSFRLSRCAPGRSGSRAQTAACRRFP
ncbi:MAG: hypothetical protein ACE5OQ_14205, partial [Woeseia sp.]